MSVYFDRATNYLQQQGIKFTTKGDLQITVSYNTENLPHVKVLVFFDDDGTNMFTTRTWEIASFKGKEAAGYALCNELNGEYRWGKFFVDKDSDLCFQCDAWVSEATCGEETLYYIRRAVAIVDDAYPKIARARFA